MADRQPLPTPGSSLFSFVRRLRVARRVFPGDYGWRLLWRWARDNS